MADSQSGWGRDLQQYTFEKTKEAAAISLPQLRQVRVDVARRARCQRDIDIITSVAKTDAGVDQLNREKELRKAHPVAAMNRALNASHHWYDVITSKPAYSIDPVAARKHSEAATHPVGLQMIPQRAYRRHDLITNQEIESRGDIPSPKVKCRPNLAARRQRDIISHFNSDGSSAKAPTTSDRNRHTDIFTQLSEDEKQQFEEAARRRPLPCATVRRSEGYAFDILTNHITKPKEVAQYDVSAVRGVHQRAAIRQAWEMQRDFHEAACERDARRSIGRFVAQRNLDEITARGYDIISTREFRYNQSNKNRMPIKSVEQIGQRADSNTTPSQEKGDSIKVQKRYDRNNAEAIPLHQSQYTLPQSTFQRVFNSP